MTSHWLGAVLTAIAIALPTSAPLAAQEALQLKAGKSWKHKHSEITVPATLAGTLRERGMAYAADDLDVGLSYTVGDAAESLTFYIFRNTNGAVPVWFAQAQWGIENSGTFGRPSIVFAPQALVPPGQNVASGLKAVYEPDKGNYRSTGVMLLPVGKWYVKIRASSQTRSPAELSNWMDTALADIGWPKNMAAAAAALPVTACAAPLHFAGKSNDASGDLTTEALGVALVSAADGDDSIEKKPASNVPVQWCRDRQLDNNIAAFRPDGSETGYLLAYGDNGNGIWAGPSPMTIAMEEIARKNGTKAAARYSVTLHTAAQDINFILQDRLPSPERTLEILDANRRASTVATWGKDRKVQINSAPQ